MKVIRINLLLCLCLATPACERGSRESAQAPPGRVSHRPKAAITILDKWRIHFGEPATFAKARAALPSGDVVVKGVCIAERNLFPIISPSIDVPGWADVEAAIRLVGPGRPPGNPHATVIHLRYFFFAYKAVWRGRYLIRKRGIVYLVFNRRGRYMQAWVILRPRELKQ